MLTHSLGQSSFGKRWVFFGFLSIHEVSTGASGSKRLRPLVLGRLSSFWSHGITPNTGSSRVWEGGFTSGWRTAEADQFRRAFHAARAHWFLFVSSLRDETNWHPDHLWVRCCLGPLPVDVWTWRGCKDSTARTKDTPWRKWRDSDRFHGCFEVVSNRFLAYSAQVGSIEMMLQWSGAGLGKGP